MAASKSSRFHHLALPRLKRLPGMKALICDNLSSHLSVSIINSCRENNIEFVCLPPNSTDKLQPLDVGVFCASQGYLEECPDRLQKP
jgi:hypothetical protein